MGTTITNQNSINQEPRSISKTGKAGYRSVQDRVPSSLLSKNIKLKIYSTVILLVIWYGSGTWSLTLRKEHRLKVFEIMVPRKVFGPEWDKVTGQLYNEEIYYLFSSPNIIQAIKSRRMRWAGNVVWGEKS